MTIKVKDPQDLMKDNLIVKHYAGSRAYGTALPTSDTDFRGIFVADPVNIRTPFFPVREVDDTNEEDTKLYELGQFMRLTLDCNPNVIESLWVEMEDVVESTDAYLLLRAHAPDLLSSKIAFTTSGYAISQLKRLKQSKQKVNYLPDLQGLCNILKRAITTGEIDKSFIMRECGEGVFRYMEENGYFV